MSVSGILLVVLVVALFGLAVAYAVLATARPNVLDSLTPNMGVMSKAIRIGNAGDGRDKFLATPGGTIMSYIYTSVNNKTPQIGGTQNPITILALGEAMKLQLLPGGVSVSPKTVLAVKTQNPNPTASNIETFDVADFPQQRWVHTAIVREGRRYTVYYNGKIVASVRTQYYPVIDSSTLMLGDPRLVGEFVYPKIAPTPYRIEEIENEINKTATTRFEPIRPMDWGQLTNISLGCPNGLFCFSTQGPPKESPLKMWKTPYA